MNKIQVTDKLINSVESLYKTGMRRKNIANKLGVSEWSVRLAMKHINKIPGLVNKTNKAHTLTDKKKQCILGSLLGDASLSYYRNTYMLSMTHSKKQYDYISHKSSIIGSSVYKISSSNSYSQDSIKYKISYQNKGLLEKISEIVFSNGCKYVNETWMDNLTLEGIAYWYMDDGSSSWRRNKTSSFVRFSTLLFDDLEIDLLIDKLKTFDFNPRINKSTYGNGKIIALGGKDSQKFYRSIKPFIIPSMKYKLKTLDSVL